MVVGGGSVPEKITSAHSWPEAAPPGISLHSGIGGALGSTWGPRGSQGIDVDVGGRPNCSGEPGRHGGRKGRVVDVLVDVVDVDVVVVI